MNLPIKKLTTGLCCSILVLTTTFGDSGSAVERRVFRPLPQTRYQFSGFLQDYLSAITTNWLLVAPDKHPEMLCQVQFQRRSEI